MIEIREIEAKARELLLADLRDDFTLSTRRVFTGGFAMYVYPLDGARLLTTKQIQDICCNLYFAYTKFLTDKANQRELEHNLLVEGNHL